MKRLRIILMISFALCVSIGILVTLVIYQKNSSENRVFEEIQIAYDNNENEKDLY